MLVRLMSHRFDPITIGIDDEGGVVVRVIFGPQAGLAVIAAAGAECRRVERVDRTSIGCAETDVAVERGCVTIRRDPERQRLFLERMGLVAAVARGVLDIEHAAIAQRRERRVVEGTGSREIADADRDVVNHRPNGLPPPPPGMRPGSPWRIRPFFPSFWALRIMSDMSWYCFRSRFTSGTVVPEPIAIRRRREPLSTFGFRRSFAVIEEMIASCRFSSFSSMFAPSICFLILPMPGSMPIRLDMPPILRSCFSWEARSSRSKLPF